MSMLNFNSNVYNEKVDISYIGFQKNFFKYVENLYKEISKLIKSPN